VCRYHSARLTTGQLAGSAPPPATWELMLINLLPDFFAALQSSDPAAAYQRYFDAHKRLLSAYWQNYVVDPDGAHFQDVVQSTVAADRSDLRAMLERTDVVSLARATEEQCATLLDTDVDVDVVLMVGVGAANAGELVVDGRGIAFVCLEHFTSVANPETQGLGLDPELVPLWLAHEIAHAVRYTSPGSRSEMRALIDAAGGYYSYWETGRHATLRELLVNEGLAVQVWVVNERADILRLFDWGVDGIISDRPDVAVAARDDALQLTNARVLPSAIAEILPGGASGADRL